MNALSKLLTRVARRVLANNPTNEVMLETADRVVLWRNAEYIGDAEVDEIAAALPDAPGEPSAADAQVAELSTGAGRADAGEAGATGEPTDEADAQAVLDALGSRPTKAELLEAAETLGVEVPEGATNPEIYEAIKSA